MTTFETTTFDTTTFDTTTFDTHSALAPGAVDPTRSGTAPTTADLDAGVDIGQVGLVALLSAFVVFTVWGTDSAVTLGAFVFFVALSAWSVLRLDRPSDDGELTRAAPSEASSSTGTVPILEHHVA